MCHSPAQRDEVHNTTAETMFRMGNYDEAARHWAKVMACMTGGGSVRARAEALVRGCHAELPGGNNPSGGRGEPGPIQLNTKNHEI